MLNTTVAAGRHRLPVVAAAVVLRGSGVLLTRLQHGPWQLPEGLLAADDDVSVALPVLLHAATGQHIVVGPEVQDYRSVEHLGPAMPANDPSADSGPVGSVAAEREMRQVVIHGCHLQGRAPLQVPSRDRQVAWLPVDELPDGVAARHVSAIQAWRQHPAFLLQSPAISAD